jgi:hypothetical protein
VIIFGLFVTLLSILFSAPFVPFRLRQAYGPTGFAAILISPRSGSDYRAVDYWLLAPFP